MNDENIDGSKLKKGRGAQHNPHNKFLQNSYEMEDEFKNYCHLENENINPIRTEYLEIFPKTIVNKVTSPDIGFVYSLNPYQGCEHGCVYCYARNTHEYYGYSAGEDFERKILVKKNAAALLDKELQKKNWKPELIMLSGNTDCYQPIERKLRITRSILEVMNKRKHPVGIITKNSLIKRDLDILKELNADNLLRVTLSITTLNEATKCILEPRTASIKQRLNTLELLAKNNISVNVNMAPIIPSINSDEILELAKAVSDKGAKSISYIMVRLNGQVGAVFENWIRKAMPLRAEKVLNLIKETHDGKLNDSRWKKRMSGDGVIAQQVKDLFRIARLKYFKNQEKRLVNTELFHQFKSDQMKLF